MVAAAVSAALIAYNNLLNLWPPFHGLLYAPLNAAMTAGLVTLAAGPLGVTRGALGLARGWWPGALAGAGMGAALASPLIAATASPRTARLVADARVAGMGPRRVAYRALVEVPVGTALLEETAFRGLLPALWRRRAAVRSSLAFGLWHVTPTLNLVRANRPGASGGAVAAAVAGAVMLTGAAGMGLVWLRRRFGGLGAPIAMHATLNSLATLAAFLARRRLERREAPATPRPAPGGRARTGRTS